MSMNLKCKKIVFQVVAVIIIGFSMLFISPIISGATAYYGAEFNTNNEYFTNAETTIIEVSGTRIYDEAYKVLAYVNKERQKLGLNTLTIDSTLTEYAMVRAAELTVCFAHSRPNGGRNTGGDGENLARFYTSAEDVYNALASDDHYDTMIDSRYVSIGIGCFKNSNGTLYWAQEFGFGQGNGKYTTVNQVVSQPIEVELTSATVVYVDCCHHWWQLTKAAGCMSGNRTYTCTQCGATKKVTNSHTYDSGVVTKAATCAETGVKTYTCTVCGKTKTKTIAKTTSHSWSSAKFTTKATTDSSGVATYTCTVCGKTKTKSYAKIKSVTLSTTSYTYNGKAKTPTVTVKNADGNTISSKYYTVTYINRSTGKTVKSMKSVGKYYVKIKFKGKYSGTVKKAVTIKPITPDTWGIVVPKSGVINVHWEKITTQTTGYQIQYSTSKKFTSKTTKTKTIKSNKTTSATLKNLKSNKTYYVRIRTYKTVKINGKSTKIYSSWSNVASLKPQ